MGHVEKIRYQLLSDEYLEQTTECAASLWVTQNVIAKAFGISYDEYYPTAQKVCKKALQDSLGIIAVDITTNKVVGFDLSMDFIDEVENEKSKGDGEKFKIWGNFLLEMLSFFKDKYKHELNVLNRGEVLCHNLIGVLPEYAPQKIGIALLKHAIDLARTRGYKQVLTVATHIASQKISEKLGFQPVGALQCAYPPLQKINVPTHAVIYVYEMANSKL